MVNQDRRRLRENKELKTLLGRIVGILAAARRSRDAVGGHLACHRQGMSSGGLDVAPSRFGR